jgi:hypothetical protein
MTVPMNIERAAQPAHPVRRAGLRVTQWVLGILGGIGAFLGGFILLAGPDQSVGIGGAASWQVGEIDPAWGWGLLVAGAVALVAAAALALRDRARGSGPAQAATGRADVLAHTAVFAAVNAFLWLQDILIGGGLNYAYWVTIPWGIGLVAHALTAGRGDEPTPPAPG